MHDKMSPQIFAIWSGFIEDQTGIHYAIADRDLLADKVASRALEAGFDSVLDYYYYLRYDAGSAAELDLLIDALVVGETFFFREFSQLDLIVRDFVEPALANGHRPRIWSAACATGEEILSLAMVLAERGLLRDVDLVASDISLRALARARSGRFGRRSLRDVPVPKVAQRWLEVCGDHYVVSPELTSAVSFLRINLTKPDEVRQVGPCDVILCRNVLIYFRDDAVQKVVQLLEGQLRGNGALFVGISESLLRFSTGLECQEHRGVFLYRKMARP